jgi:ATP-dependent DNA helicase RecQ
MTSGTGQGALLLDSSRTSLEDTLRSAFGIARFREGQRDVIESIMAGRHTLVVMPTGGGKSLCYQLPALLLEGVTLVVSPLIALMKDQVDALTDLGLPATFVNSSLEGREQSRRLREVAAGRIKLLFVAPERFRSDAFWEALESTPVALLAVDEAHCISQWGHDFRPDYAALGAVRERLGHPVTVALTATATPKVRDDIKAQLRIEEARTFLSGFERENLFLEVYKADSRVDKLRRLRALLESTGPSGIVYCQTRKAVEEVAEHLAGGRFKVGYYHGGLTDEQRVAVQDDFMDGAVEVLVATNAFGMGVDKADIRAIVHYQIPGSLEAYYQEAGRAGRDGEPAHCLLLYSYADRRVLDFFIEHAHPPRWIVEQVWTTALRLATGDEGVDRHRLESALRHVHGMSVESSLNILARAGHLRLDWGGRGRGEGDGRQIVPLDNTKATALRVDFDAIAEHQAYEEERLKRVIFYATGGRCRNGDILRYFGSKAGHKKGCGHCDNCAGQPVYTKRPAAPAPKARRAAAARPEGDTAEVVVRKLCAGIARCKQEETARTVAQVLSGSRALSLRRKGLHRLSTHGILAYLNRRQVEAMLDLLVSAGFFVVARGSLAMSGEAVAVMKGEARLPDPLARQVEVLLKS